MTTWTNRPDDRTHQLRYPLIRVLPGRQVSAIILDADLTGCYTHFWRGRTTPCHPPDCEACEAGRKPRWYGYLTIWNPQATTRAILELTPPCIPAIEAHLRNNHTLRNARITARRASKRPNARLIVELDTTAYAGPEAPQPVDIQAELCRMWEIPLDHTPLKQTPAEHTPATLRYPGSNGQIHQNLPRSK